jgi:hypothetical protein
MILSRTTHKRHIKHHEHGKHAVTTHNKSTSSKHGRCIDILASNIEHNIRIRPPSPVQRATSTACMPCLRTQWWICSMCMMIFHSSCVLHVPETMDCHYDGLPVKVLPDMHGSMSMCVCCRIFLRLDGHALLGGSAVSGPLSSSTASGSIS